jgi:hypothetical protein
LASGEWPVTILSGTNVAVTFQITDHNWPLIADHWRTVPKAAGLL